MARVSMKPSEYGGSDTDRTLGIQPAPHQLRPEESLRVMYGQDAMDPETTVPPELSELKTDPGA